MTAAASALLRYTVLLRLHGFILVEVGADVTTRPLFKPPFDHCYLPCTFLAGGPDSCKTGTFTLASTAPGMQAALASPNEAYVLALSQKGQVTITERATGRVLLNSGSTSIGCASPFRLVLQPNGLLLLTDRRGSVVWASGSACAGNTSCYSYALQNDGQLVIKDGDGAEVWSSGSAGAAAGQGQLGQIVSGGRPGTSCIHSGPLPAASQLLSTSQQYKLVVQQQGARLQLVDTTTTSLLWTPVGALTGGTPAKLCISSQGSLDLSWGGAQQLWSSGLAGPASAGPYVALVSTDGCLEIFNGTCRKVWSSHVQGSRRQRAQPPQLQSTTAGNASPPRQQRASRPPFAINTQAGGKPAPPVGGARRGPPPFSPPSKRPPLPSAQLVMVPRRTSPPVKPRPSPVRPVANAHMYRVPAASRRGTPGAAVKPAHDAAACSLQQGQLCGGITMCGISGPCLHMDCCSGQLACSRRSDFVWLCG